MRPMPVVVGALLGLVVGICYALTRVWQNWYEAGDVFLVTGFVGVCLGAAIGLAASALLRR